MLNSAITIMILAACHILFFTGLGQGDYSIGIFGFLFIVAQICILISRERKYMEHTWEIRNRKKILFESPEEYWNKFV